MQKENQNQSQNNRGFEKFIFKDYSFDFSSGVLKLNYSLDNQIEFEEKLIFPVKNIQWKNVNKQALNLAFNAILLAGGISYYKSYCPSKIEIQSEKLKKEQVDFWNKYYQHGLGEFFSQNRIDFQRLINFPLSLDTPSVKSVKKNSIKLNLSERSLLPIGGGKDSIVSSEILKSAAENFMLFNVRESEPIKNTAQIMGGERLIVEREISPKLLELNAQGALNGHVPITGYISFILVASAILYDYKNLIMSLEMSANFGNFEYLGMEINHQYSKSEEFEIDFNTYLKNYISPSIKLFSLLRQWQEIKITKIFSELKNVNQYLPVMTSCNTNFKITGDKPKTLWCGKCPKCAFVFLMLAPFISKIKLIKIFGKNLLNDQKLILLYKELLGLENVKPFECVGTPEECFAAFDLVSQKSEYIGDLALEMFKLEKKYLNHKLNSIIEVWNDSDSLCIPEKFKKILKNF